jgi:hypothetical protein
MIFIACRSYQTARHYCPRAQTISRVPGGFMCFALRADYLRWKRTERAELLSLRAAAPAVDQLLREQGIIE